VVVAAVVFSKRKPVAVAETGATGVTGPAAEGSAGAPERESART